MKINFLNFPKIFFFIVSLLTFIQLSFASFKGELKLDEDKIREYAITFKVFEKEFIFTNSIEDYYRSFKRLIDKYNITHYLFSLLIISLRDFKQKTNNFHFLIETSPV